MISPQDIQTSFGVSFVYKVIPERSTVREKGLLCEAGTILGPQTSVQSFACAFVLEQDIEPVAIKVLSS